MKVKALKPWSNGEISMEQYEVRDLPDVLAQNLIDAGIVVEIGGGSGGGVLVVTFTQDPDTAEWSADKTFAECVAAWGDGKTLFAYYSGTAVYLPMSFYNSASLYMEFVAVDGETGTAFGFGIDEDGAYYYGGE